MLKYGKDLAKKKERERSYKEYQERNENFTL